MDQMAQAEILRPLLISIQTGPLLEVSHRHLLERLFVGFPRIRRILMFLLPAEW
jgi:hypothetical protein